MPGRIPRTWRRAGTGNAPMARGYTLIELIMAVTLLAIISVAVCMLTFGAFNTDRYLRTRNTSVAEIELATVRLANNIRAAQTGTITVGTGTLSTVTQADTAHGYPNGVTVSYALQTDPLHAGMKQLIENDPRYGTTNVLATNVATFTVAAVAGVTGLYQVDIVINSQPIEERHFQVLGRN